MEPTSKSFKKRIWIIPIALLTCTLFLYFSLETPNLVEKLKSSTLKTKYNVTSITKSKFEAKRFIHLDLKGAPPKISYYKRLFPLFARLGADGLLIEYEDMFPYTGNILKHIPARNAYSSSDIETINLLAEENNLTVIPLVQTFGHLEFILKLRKFSFLREVPKYPQVICPTHNMTLTILSEIIRQIIQGHPKSTMIHIGADEVYHIGQCSRCRRIMFDIGISKWQLFLTHIKTIATHIKLKFPHMKILMWDDGFRNIKEDDLRHSGINTLVEPIVWKYSPSVETSLYFLDKYVNVFHTLWFASAFKGATGSNQYLTPISHHLANHYSWLKVYMKYKDRVSIGGIFMTGWQRYDHFATLCELLPVAIPSLVYSFSALSGQTPTSFIQVLYCKYYYALTNPNVNSPYCQYPGAEILDAMVSFHQFKLKYNDFKQRSSVLGWMGYYNGYHNFSNPDLVNRNFGNLADLLNQLISIDAQLMETMEKVYDSYTSSEWQETFLKPIYDEINTMIKTSQRLLSVDEWQRRPL